ncbi:putative radical SAM domain-containing protein [Neospora caninum Liverpool]|uniref:Threonylcarbamoyladenosine tRNA methylthiotransferase n=1 Tax=Neospora caninum (strain Liverpool) TaxID=572307 RepID=F0VIU0_NEOCL|nr:putative radical SAM domain-containing protein [Neospora caninum Liverpool]CBZ53651.1 putative radical SAM domain-containing protein [Neospora caninum Liverpool]CEL67642.1 TPA: radical SAM domain-containing protein, putative [Neospora caninum Liverpool]|eukprot:XP_003883683.1 putative radical SAM domain-containing protein [Neospora caninum Liverpool]
MAASRHGPFSPARGGEGEASPLSAVVGGTAWLVWSSATAALGAKGSSWRSSSALLPALAVTAGVGCAVGYLLYSSGVSFRLRRGQIFGSEARAEEAEQQVSEESSQSLGKSNRGNDQLSIQESGGDDTPHCGADRCCVGTAKETPGCRGGVGGCAGAECCQSPDGETRQTEVEQDGDGEGESECDLEDLQSSDDEGADALDGSGAPYIQPTFPRVKHLKRPLRRAVTENRENKAEAEKEDPREDGKHAESDGRRGVGEAASGKDFFQPGKQQKIYVKTFGCAHNQSDSEYMMGLLDAAGYTFVSRMEEADVCLINSCTVKSPSEFALYSVIQEALQIEVPSASLIRAQQRAKAAKNGRGESLQCASSCSASPCCSSGLKKDERGDEVGEGEGHEEHEEEAQTPQSCTGCGGANSWPSPRSLEQRTDAKEEEREEAKGAGEGSKKDKTHSVTRRPIPCVVAGCVPYGMGGETRDDHRRKKGTSGKNGDGEKHETKKEEGKGEKKQSAQRDLLKLCSIVGVSAIDRIVEAVEEALKGNVIRLGGKKRLPSLDLPKIRRNALVEIVPISTGCLGSCTYCKTKHARGELGSYPEEAIETRIEASLLDGVKQIWLTSEDSGAYGLDRQSSLTSLLARLLRNVFDRRADPSLMLRVGMSNPPFLLQQLKSAVQVFAHPNVFEFLHLPLQSGSNDVLLAMNREYTAEQFEVVVETLLKHFPRMTIATDIICGFPGETEEDHEKTLAIIKKFKFPVVNISQFYPRPGTPAASMKQLPSQIVKRRSREVTALFESYTCYDWMLHTTQMVWFTGTSEKSHHTVGQTKQYVKVLTPRDDALLGTGCPMYITAVDKWHVVAVRTQPTEKKIPQKD